MKNIVKKLNSSPEFMKAFYQIALQYYEKNRNKRSLISPLDYLKDENYKTLSFYYPEMRIYENKSTLQNIYRHITFNKNDIRNEDIYNENVKKKRKSSCNTLPWCKYRKEPACCCECEYCEMLPINLKCSYHFFFNKWDDNNNTNANNLPDKINTLNISR